METRRGRRPSLLRGLVKAVFRPLAFVSKEFVLIRRQPRLILMLVAGPFLVLLLFGLGYSSDSQPVRTILVLPTDPRLPDGEAAYREEFIPPFTLEAVTRDRDAALAQLARRRVDAVVVFPDRAAETIREGQQATLRMYYNELDPLQRSWLEYYGWVQTTELNRRVLVQVLERNPNPIVAESAPGLGLAQLVLPDQEIPPAVLVSPFKPAGENIAPTSPDFVQYYAPGVLALLVQHLAVTLTALTLVRERLRGALEIFSVSPVSPREVLMGKYVSHFLQTALLAAALVALFLFVLEVPVLAPYVEVAGMLVLLIAASLGVGLLISAVSRSETQAVQFAMLVLLASVFFSGFFLPLRNLIEPVWAVSYSLPVTYGIAGLQSLMLRGEAPALWVPLALGGLALVLFLATLMIFRRTFSRA